MLGPLSQQKGAKRFTGVAAGAKLILPRRWFPGAQGGTTFSVPAGASWIIVRAVGPGGGPETAQGRPGGGGAFAREDRACAPGQTVVVSVSAGSTGSGSDTSISLAGTVICLAAGGRAGVSGTSGLGGKATDSTGTIRSSGGDGASTAGGSASNAGTNGAPGGNPGAGAGGGSAGESNATDALILGGRGADGFGGGSRGPGRGQTPGGGASLYEDAALGRQACPGGDGLAVIEFWSAKP